MTRLEIDWQSTDQLLWGWSGRAMELGNFLCWDILLIQIIIGQGTAVLAGDEGGGVVDIFVSLIFLTVSRRHPNTD